MSLTTGFHPQNAATLRTTYKAFPEVLNKEWVSLLYTEKKVVTVTCSQHGRPQTGTKKVLTGASTVACCSANYAQEGSCHVLFTGNQVPPHLNNEVLNQ